MAATLKLIVVGYAGEPRPGLSKRFGDGRSTIGRGLDNDWVLPDPEKHLSNHHCLIEQRDGRYVIFDTSRNGVFLNGNEAPLGNGRSSILSNGDRVVIGDYEIRVEIEGAARDPTPFSPAFAERGAAAALPAGIEPANTPFRAHGDAFEPLPGEPFAPLPSEPFAPLPGSEALAPLPGSEALAPPPAGDPFAPPAAPPESGRTGAPDPNHVAAIDTFFRAPDVKAPIIPLDWNPLAPEAAPQPALPEAKEFELPEAKEFEPPAPRTASPTPRQSPPVRAHRVAEAASGAPGPGQAEMLRAFLEGAGLPEAAIGAADPAASLRRYGEIFRELVAGVRELMATRALMKSEFRIEQTIIRARDNNALKFSVDLEQALRAMLLPQGSGYAEPLAAAREAITDLKAHEIALIAGLERAVARLLEALAPAEVEHSIEATGMLASVLPGARKARYWEAYGALYNKLAEEIREDVHGVFRQSFADAYSEQVKKL